MGNELGECFGAVLDSHLDRPPPVVKAKGDHRARLREPRNLLANIDDDMHTEPPTGGAF